MTRASGASGTFENGKWSTPYGLSNVNTASVNGALKYIISETIDLHTGYTNDTIDGCHRKNWVNYIHFYKFTICNTDEALWWFNYRKAGYGGVKEGYELGEYGQFVTFDEGHCHDSVFCDFFHGERNRPTLGSYIGWQDNTNDVRNPTDGAYWYSIPGECPQEKWVSKSESCKVKQPSGQCPEGMIPDGSTCTWSYEMLGQVVLDDLVGITSIKNAKTGRNFTNSTEYCMAGKVEFERNRKTNDFVRGLSFWKKPLDRKANRGRIEKLLNFYTKSSENIPLPSALTQSNPRCYTSTPHCFERGQETCTRDTEQLCVPCEDMKGGCSSVVDRNAAFNPQALSKVKVPKGPAGDALGPRSISPVLHFNLIQTISAMLFVSVYLI